MNYYYLMNTTQKDGVTEEQLEATPYSNIVGDLWIVEANVSGLSSEQQFTDTQQCIDYIQEFNSEWDEFYDLMDTE
jgi:hypothetical protein